MAARSYLQKINDLEQKVDQQLSEKEVPNRIIFV